MENPNKAVENRRLDGTFGAGNNANPAGRPKGKSLKEYWKQRFADMTDEEKLAFSNSVAPELLWKMAEGNPPESIKLSGDEKNPIISITYISPNGYNPSSDNQAGPSIRSSEESDN